MCCVVAIRSWCKLHSIHTNGSMIFHQGRGNLPCSAIMKLRGTGKKWPTTSPFRNGQSSTSRCLFTGPVCSNWVLLQVMDLRNVLWHSRRTLLTCAVPALVSSLQVWDGLMCETLNTDNINNSFSYIQYTLHCLCSMKQFCWWNYVPFLLPQVLQYYKQWLELLGSWLSSPHCLPQLDLCLSVSHLDYLKRIFHIIFEC